MRAYSEVVNHHEIGEALWRGQSDNEIQGKIFPNCDKNRKGLEKPVGLLVSYLVCWYMRHWGMNLRTSYFMVVQKKLSCRLQRVLVVPRWLPNGVEWNSSSRREMKLWLWGSQIFCLWKMRPRQTPKSGWLAGVSWVCREKTLNS